jgi:hypothetical protein
MRLEERLRISESGSAASSLLWAQWCFDKALVKRSLNVISAVFPHYSLHEESHSLSIIAEIEKILGPNVEFLSFVDAWLLLEASYWHDIGMIVPYDEKKAIIEKPEFRHFLDQMAVSGSDYADYARVYSAHLNGTSTALILDLERAFTFLLAEYIRKTHPERSKQFLLNPESIGIKSPDTGLISSRLFTLLGDIIVCHGKPFSSVLELPFENDGLEVGDIAHPRLVAGLLRLGDLLDLDDGRHCPTQLLSVGKLPALTKAHLEKHRSIVSKSVTAYSIDIRARCQTFASFEVQNDWFGYIEKEVEDQDRYWGDIASRNYIGKLPTIKGLICDLEGSVFLGRNASRFSLDTNRIYAFLTGQSIYENPLVSILEVLQNSVDATLDRIWLEHQDIIKTFDDVKSLRKNYPITVSVTTQTLPDGKVEYQVAVADAGKGMTLDDIRSILTIASDLSQNRKQTARQGMPSWMLPSGFFGIGLQSVFSVSEEILIETKSASDSLYEIVIRATKGKTPSFVVKKKDSSTWKFGTTVKFSIIDEAIPDKISGNLAIRRSLARFDPLKDSILNAKEAQIEEEVAEFGQFCVFAIYFNGQEMESYRDQFKICDTENGIEYAIEFTAQPHLNDWQFRGRPFKTNTRFNYFNIRGNIISERADTFLPLSREKIHLSGQEILENKVFKSLNQMQNDILTTITNKSVASFFYFLHDNPIDESWHSIEIAGKRIIDLLQSETTIYVSFELHDEHKPEDLKDETLVSTHLGGAAMLVDAAMKLKLGVVIQNILKLDVPVMGSSVGQTRPVVIFQVQFVKEKNLSTISDTSLSFLSSENLDDSRERYWLPCGQDQFPELSINSNNEYSWILPLTPFYIFFPQGIVLRATSKSIDQDIPVLVRELRKHKKELSEALIDRSLREFYRKYPFESKHVNEDFLRARRF